MKKLLLFGLLGLRLAAQPVITVPPTNQIALNGSNVIFGIAVSGTGPFTYQWQFNVTNLPNNIITTVAGTNFSGVAGDGGAATNARLSAPKGITTDSAGNLYIADNYNNRIRLVNTNGMINTVAGTNVSIFSALCSFISSSFCKIIICSDVSSFISSRIDFSILFFSELSLAFIPSLICF